MLHAYVSLSASVVSTLTVRFANCPSVGGSCNVVVSSVIVGALLSTSRSHVLLHPSPDAVFPSSHSSPASVVPSPQNGLPPVLVR